MRNLIVLTAATLFVLAMQTDSRATLWDYRAAVFADGPVGYWPLDEISGTSAADISGNSLTGTYAGGVGLNTPGAFGTGPNTGTAAFFNGTSSQVSVVDPGVSPLDVTAITMEAWVKWDGVSDPERMVMNKESAWETAIKSGIQQSAIETTDAAPWAWIGSGAVSADEWIHYAVTYDGTSIRQYLNGIQQGAAYSAAPGAIVTNDSLFYIGRRPSGSYFSGSIDEVAVYGTALSAAQIQFHIEQALLPVPPAPEPSSLLLLCLGTCLLSMKRRRSSQQTVHQVA